MTTYLKVPEFNSKYSIVLLVIRIQMGIAMILHGWPKIQAPFSWMPPEAPIPGIFQFLAALSEFGGGIALLIGLLTPLASLGLFFTMVVAAAFHISKGDPYVGFTGSYEPAAVYVGLSLLFLVFGPGKFSLDAKLFGSRS